MVVPLKGSRHLWGWRQHSVPTCAGDTSYDPTNNAGFSVVDLTQVFGARLDSYNAGGSVPLYDAFGGSVLLDEDDEVSVDGNGDSYPAYPPLCATRYVEELDTSVSEWMFCTDRASQTCGDTDSAGNLVDQDGNLINPMTERSGNPRLSADQEKLIAYLIQNGHPYEGVGNQAWGGVTEARSDLGTDERTALQTLVWCISDAPEPGEATDFADTCENSMDAAEQARLLQMISDNPEVTLCATVAAPGTATLSMYATPPSTEHIGWAQSVNDITPPCQVYATFHEVNLASVTASAAALFETVDTTAPVPEPAPTDTPTDTPITAPVVPELVETGITTDRSPLWLGFALIGLGSVAIAARTRVVHNRR